jgi:hypothetical protein
MGVARMPAVVRVIAPRDATRPLARGGGARQTIRLIGPGSLIWLGLMAELGWGFVGSLGLGLGVSTSAAGPGGARLWLIGACIIGVVVAGLVQLTRVEER